MDILVNEIYICKSCLLNNECLGKVLIIYNNTCLVKIITCSETDETNIHELNYLLIVKKSDMRIVEKTFLDGHIKKIIL